MVCLWIAYGSIGKNKNKKYFEKIPKSVDKTLAM